MKKTVGFWIAALLALVPAFSQDASSDFDAPTEVTAASPIDWGTLKYSGDQELAWRWGAYDPATWTGGSLDSTMRAEYKRGDVKMVAGGSVRYNEFVPEETAVFWSPGSFKFGAGLQEFSWGVADKVNPTDTLNARDYRHRLDAPRLVNPAASVNWYPVTWMSVEAVYEPWKNTSKYPTDFSVSTQAGLTANAAALNTATALLGSPLATYAPTSTTATVAQDFGTPVWGGRVNFFLTGVDLAFSYLCDRDAFLSPQVVMKSYGGVWVPQTVNLVYNPVQRFGLNAKTTVDRYGFWVESVYNRTAASSIDDVTNRHDSLEWTTGMDFNYGPGSVYYANLQYAGVWVVNYDASAVAASKRKLTRAQLTDANFMSQLAYRTLTQPLGDQTEQMLNSLTVNLKWPLLDSTLTPTLSGVVSVPFNYDTTNQTRYAATNLNPEIDWMPADGLHVLFGADLAYAWVKLANSDAVTLDTTTDRIGVYTPQNNLYVKADYKWNGSLGFNAK